jgi:hypothetical protein
MTICGNHVLFRFEPALDSMSTDLDSMSMSEPGASQGSSYHDPTEPIRLHPINLTKVMDTAGRSFFD